MEAEKFEGILQRRLNLTKAVLGAKAQEYAADNDRLHNFHTIARIEDKDPVLACWDLMLKHFVSVRDIVQYEHSICPETRLDEKIGDLINYMILLEALIIERNQRLAEENESAN